MSVLTFPSSTRSLRPRSSPPAGRLVAWAVQAWRARQADRALSLLSDEMLHDIGVSRGEIPDVIRHGRPARR